METIKISIEKFETRLTEQYLNALVEHLKKTDLESYNQVKNDFFQNLKLPTDQELKIEIEKIGQVEFINSDINEVLQTMIENMIEKY